MGDKRRYDRAFKLEVVHLTRQPGKTVTGVARELGIPWKTVSGWVERWNKQDEAAFLEPAKGASGAKPAHKHALSTRELEVENQQLRKENEVLRQERELLKKATACLGQNGTPPGRPASSPGNSSEVRVHRR